MSTIQNGKDTALNAQTGSVPNVSSALKNWFQPMVFSVVTKTVTAFQVEETKVDVNFRGVIQPLTAQRISLKSEGQRAWTWLWLHSDTSLQLSVDDVVTYLGVQTRVMARKDYKIYGYIEYELVQDWTGSGPSDG